MALTLEDYNRSGVKLVKTPTGYQIGDSSGVANISQPEVDQLLALGVQPTDVSQVRGGAGEWSAATGINWNTSGGAEGISRITSALSRLQQQQISQGFDEQARQENIAGGFVPQQSAAQTLPGGTIPPPTGQLTFPAGSAAAQLNQAQTQAAQTGQTLTPEQQMQASLKGNNVNAPGITPVAPGQPQQTQQPIYQTNAVMDQTQNFANNPQAQQQGFYKVKVPVTAENPGGFNIYKADGTEVKDVNEFKSLGLNADWIPEKTPDGQAGTSGQSKSPTDFAGMYTEAIKALGLTDIKSAFEDTQKKFADLQNELNDKITEVNDNPWLSEGLRTKRIASLQEKYEGKLSNLTNQMELYDSQYKLGVAQAQYLTTGAYNQAIDTATLALKAEEAQSRLDQQEFENQLDLAGLSLKERELALEQYKASKTGSGTTGVLSNLPTSVQTQLTSIANSFGSTDIVKKFNATVDGLNLVNGISASSKNPSDHQTIVYAFAKSLDPESVVREGEYATIKKYAQSALSKYGKEITNALNGTGFLSQAAIQNIKDTMLNNYNSRKPAYDNLYSEKSRVINNLAGADVAKDIMVDYKSGVSGIEDPADTPIGETYVKDNIIYYRQDEDTFRPVGSAQ